MKRLLLRLSAVFLLFSCSGKDSSNETMNVQDLGPITKLLNDSVPVRFGGNAFVVLEVDGRRIYEKGYGGYDGNTVQFIASCSKWLSAAVIMSLVDDGKLSLNDTVGRFLPAFTARGKGGSTVRQLFSHTSGFPGQSVQGYEREFNLSLAASVDSIAARVPMRSEPGRSFEYGEVSMQIGGRIAEVVSGKGWNQLFAEKIGGPCEMASTSYGLAANPIIGGGARSCANDYMKFLGMLMSKGMYKGRRVLSENAVNTMEQNQIGNADLSLSPYPPDLMSTRGIYGIGLWRDLTGPGDQLIEGSSPGLFGAHPWMSRDKKLTGMVFTFIPGIAFVNTLPTCVELRKLTRTLVR